MKPFNKVKPFQIRWNEALGRPECPYLYRWVLLFFNYGIRLHKWIRSDDKRYMHNHSWWFFTIVLRGSYIDVSTDRFGNVKRDQLVAGSVRFRSAKHTHYVEVPEGGCLTLLITGRPIQNWGFLVNGKFKRPLKYFHKHGHPECMD